MTYSIEQPLFPGDVVVQVVDKLPNGAFHGSPFQHLDTRYRVVEVESDGCVRLAHEEANFTQVISPDRVKDSIRLDIGTPERAFSAAARHMVLVLKGERSADGDTCVYRSERGTACAVGALLRDDVAEQYEGGTVSGIHYTHLFPRVSSASTEWADPIIRVLQDMQNLHDYGRFEAEGSTALRKYRALTPGRRLHGWKRALRRYAKRRGWDVPEWLQAGGKE